MEELEFDRALASKRHKEILEALKLVSDKISVSHPSEALIEGLKKALNSIAESLKNNKDPQILEELSKISTKGCTLIINRDIQGVMESIDIVPK